jgi:hypothetical protein
MRQPFREEHRAVFREGSLIEDQKELCSIRSQTLDRMRKASREDPEVALAYVTDKHRAVGIHYGDASLAIENIGPFIGRMPVQFTEATRR